MGGDGEKSRDRRDRVHQHENRREGDQRKLKQRRHAFILLINILTPLQFQNSSGDDRTGDLSIRSESLPNKFPVSERTARAVGTLAHSQPEARAQLERK